MTALGSEEKFKSYDEVINSDLPLEVLKKVISRNGESKKYADLLALDGGTVGIAHFATGGLANLYQMMDTDKYFEKSREEMVQHYSTSCRPEGKSGNDTGWGCFSEKWWHDGMKSFLSSEESEQVQNAAWLTIMRPVIKAAFDHDWQTRRKMAIAIGIANSLGHNGFEHLAEQHGWDAEEVLNSYVGTDVGHRLRRRTAIDANFQKPQIIKAS